ncbi:Sporulation kinase E [bioreactor metagenome]|uniref:Sporulation kinase E n=1 Tax=bioreactor metagenome TaxID=1076179 RepID=A0A645A9S0_9ZZZZ
MLNEYQSVDALSLENHKLRRELEEANRILNAIKQGEIDAFLISNNLDDQVFVLKGADHIYRVLVEEMHEGYATITSDGTILFCNKNFADIVKAPLQQIIGSPIYRFLKPHDKEAFACYLSSSQNSFKVECSLKTNANFCSPVILSASKITIEEDMLTCLVVTDLTEQRRIQMFTRIIFNQTKEPIIACNSHGQIIKTNPAADLMLGNQLLGNYFDVAIPLFLESDGTRYTLKQALEYDSSSGVEVTFVRTDGGSLNLIINAGRFNPEEDDSVIDCVVTLTDITSQRQLYSELTRFDRFNLIGEMAAGIGHEVRNPLTTVRGYLQLFQQRPKFADQREQFTTMIEELDRANSIITEFLSLAKNKRVELKPGNLNGTIHALFPLLQADAFRLGHQIQTDIGDISTLCYDDKEIRQLILNIVRNGMEAMKVSGLITIATYSENDKIVLAIKDTGTGIPQEVLDKLGTPFVTTKESGTGLGLSICYRIAERHNAKIKIKTSTAGTTFFIKFSLP